MIYFRVLIRLTMKDRSEKCKILADFLETVKVDSYSCMQNQVSGFQFIAFVF